MRPLVPVAPLPGAALDHPTVGPQQLAVDPAAVRAGEERDDARDVLGRAEALERRLLGEPVDRLLILAVEEQAGRRWAGGDGVDVTGGAALLTGLTDAVALMPAGTPPRKGIALIGVDDFTVPLVLLWPAGRPSAAVARLTRALGP